MTKSIVTLALAICLCTTLSAQDPRKEIEILSVRKVTLHKFLDSDRAGVKSDLNDYGKNEASEHYLVFDPDEKWLLYYWTQQYSEILKSVIGFNAAYVAELQSKILPGQDLLYQTVKEQLLAQRNYIEEQIQLSALNETDKDFLLLHFTFLLADFDNPTSGSQDALNKEANRFLLAHPKSRYEDYVRKNIRKSDTLSSWAFNVDFFTGFGLFTDGLHKNFRNHPALGVGIDIYYKKIVLYGHLYFGFSETKDSISFQTGTWQKDARADVLLPEASIGYVIRDNKHLKLVPFIGYSQTNISPTEEDVKNIPAYENIGLDFTSTFTIGLNLDLKFGKPNFAVISATGNEESYWVFRIRYAYNSPQFDSKYNGFDGNFHYLTIGFGVFGRAMRRVK